MMDDHWFLLNYKKDNFNSELKLKAYLIAEKDGFKQSPDYYWNQAIKELKGK